MTLCTIKHLICTAIALSIVFLSQNGIYGYRQEFDMSGNAMEAIPDPPSLPIIQSEISFLDQLLVAVNENRDAYMKLQNLNRRQPNYLVKWPGLFNRELNDFVSNDVNNSGRNYKLAKSRLMERLHQSSQDSSHNDVLKHTYEETENIESSAENSETSDANQWHLKSQNIKKNVKYAHMFPCHLKQCHMGKRSV